MVRAMRSLASEVADGRLDPAALDEARIAGALDTADMPDPDLVIRTSGETRVSNFLLWQAAYAEYEFLPTLWPDFTPDTLAEVLARYATRDRRFGGVVPA
jgi:undecaprenyl diphosphate synthase